MAQDLFGVAVITREAYEAVGDSRGPLTDLMFGRNVVFRYLANLDERPGIKPLTDVPENLKFISRQGREAKEYSRSWTEGSVEFGFVEGAEDTCQYRYTFRVADCKVPATKFFNETFGLSDNDSRLWHEDREKQEGNVGYMLALQNLPNLFHGGVLELVKRPDNDVSVEFYANRNGAPSCLYDRFNRADIAYELSHNVRVVIRDVKYDDGVKRYQPDAVELVADEHASSEVKAFVDAVNQSTNSGDIQSFARVSCLHYIPQKDSPPSDELWTQVAVNLLQMPGSTLTDQKFIKGKIHINNEPDRYRPTDKNLDLVLIGLTEVSVLRHGPMVEHSFGRGWRLADNI